MRAKCTVCGGVVVGRGLCTKHYEKARYAGTLELFKPKHGEVAAWIRDNENWQDKIDCLIWPFATTRGYATAFIDGKQHYVHRYYCELLNGAPPSLTHYAAHACGQGAQACVNPHHTYWATAKQNSHDRIRHGTVNNGVRNGRAVLSQEQVQKIKVAIAENKGRSIRALAKKLGINYCVLYPIAKGKTYVDG